jgi:hypothetical protein
MTHGLSGVDALLREQGCSCVHVDPHGFARKTPPQIVMSRNRVKRQDSES